MKILRTIWILIVAVLCCPDAYCEGAVQISEYSFGDLLDAIAIVESNNNPKAVGDNGKAIGAYQIHKIYVDDVNRIMRKPLYSYKDRWDAYKSRLMVVIYLTHYGTSKTIEQMARIHNGGPTGWKKKSTLKYWEKVEQELMRGGK